MQSLLVWQAENKFKFRETKGSLFDLNLSRCIDTIPSQSSKQFEMPFVVRGEYCAKTFHKIHYRHLTAAEIIY